MQVLLQPRITPHQTKNATKKLKPPKNNSAVLRKPSVKEKFIISFHHFHILIDLFLYFLSLDRYYFSYFVLDEIGKMTTNHFWIGHDSDESHNSDMDESEIVIKVQDRIYPKQAELEKVDVCLVN